jgi:hypothetical protein
LGHAQDGSSDNCTNNVQGEWAPGEYLDACQDKRRRGPKEMLEVLSDILVLDRDGTRRIREMPSGF